MSLSDTSVQDDTTHSADLEGDIATQIATVISSAQSSEVTFDATQTQETRENQVVITVNRQNVMRDLLKAFKERNLNDSYVKIQMDCEAAKDFNKVFRDTLTEFGGQLIFLYFDGDSQASRVVSHDLTADDWEAVAPLL